MNASECVRSIKALKHYKRYRSAMIASVLAFSGIVFFGGEAEAMFRSSVSSSRSSSPVRSGQSTSLQRSTSPGPGRSHGLRSTKVLGSQDLADPSKVDLEVVLKVSIMRQESKCILVKNEANGVMYRNVPRWSWSRTLLDALVSEGKIKYSENGNGNYDILMLH